VDYGKNTVLGLDGLDLFMLPILPSLAHGAIKAKLDSITPLTFPSWVTIMTGVNLGKHGFYRFFRYEKVGARWKAHIVSAYDLQYPIIHEG